MRQHIENILKEAQILAYPKKLNGFDSMPPGIQGFLIGYTQRLRELIEQAEIEYKSNQNSKGGVQ